MDRLFRFVDNLFKLDRLDFWKQIRRMERSNRSINIKIDRFKDEYDKIFNQSNCDAREIEAEMEKVNLFLKAHEESNFKYKL